MSSVRNAARITAGPTRRLVDGRLLARPLSAEAVCADRDRVAVRVARWFPHGSVGRLTWCGVVVESRRVLQSLRKTQGESSGWCCGGDGMPRVGALGVMTGEW